MTKRTFHKFSAKSVTEDDKHFSSKLEHKYYKQLEMRQRAGEVLFFLRQVPIDLPGGIRYRIDYIEFLANGEVIFTECKGMKLAIGELKMKQVEDLYPITINVVTKV